MGNKEVEKVIVKKPSLIVRLIAKSIDFIVVLILLEIFKTPGFFAGLLYMLISDGLFQGRSIGKLLTNLRVIKSGLKVKKDKSEIAAGGAESESPASYNTPPHASTRESIIRNSPLFFALLLSKIPFLGWILAGAIVVFELIMLIGSPSSKRLGDELAGTEVVEIE